MRESIFISLVHYPVYDKRKRVVTTSITNLDLHDLARLTRTFELGGFFVVQPSVLQKELARRIISHWERGGGASYNETRKEAFKTITLTDTVESMVREVSERTGGKPTLISTTGRDVPGQVEFEEMRKILPGKLPAVFLFGTGWGLSDEIIFSSDFVLKPIKISKDYNHLSVRCAAAIILDRIVGR